MANTKTKKRSTNQILKDNIKDMPKLVKDSFKAIGREFKKMRGVHEHGDSIYIGDSKSKKEGK